jgi:hypothetical protein
MLRICWKQQFSPYGALADSASHHEAGYELSCVSLRRWAEVANSAGFGDFPYSRALNVTKTSFSILELLSKIAKTIQLESSPLLT